MTVIVGLGNPGRRYSNSRHNVGFMCVDHLARTCMIQLSERRRYAVVGQGEVERCPVVLAKPRTFMNASGQGVSYLLHRFAATPRDLLIIYDDMDLPLGTIRLRPGGGAAGHRGIASIISTLGSKEFPRLRVGIGRPPCDMDAVDFVLASFEPTERRVIRQVMEEVAQAVDYLLQDGIDTAMNRFN